MHYKCYKINLKCGGSNKDSPEVIKSKKKNTKKTPGDNDDETV